jgi:hypothetical protein
LLTSRVVGFERIVTSIDLSHFKKPDSKFLIPSFIGIVVIIIGVVFKCQLAAVTYVAASGYMSIFFRVIGHFKEGKHRTLLFFLCQLPFTASLVFTLRGMAFTLRLPVMSLRLRVK